VADFSLQYFDPLSTSDLTAIICRKFEEQPAHSLADLPPFDGAGLYAIYYADRTEALYAPLSGRLIPLYVGSAQSHNSATGASTRSSSPLRNRVRGHQQSVDESDLDITEFRVRLLLMPDVHIDLGENGLRVGYKPVWNSVLTGFGSHEQGSATRTGQKSKWDSVHPGRSRTYGRERDDRQILMADITDLVSRQVALCAANPGLDWATYDPDAIRVFNRPTKSALKAEWVDYAVDSHGVDREEAEAMTKRKLIELCG
jgi:hypothetical protein